MSSPKKDKNGTWYFVAGVRDEITGERIQKRRRGFKSKSEAEKAMAKLVTDHSEGNYIDPSKINFGKFMDEWLETKKENMTRLTIDSYKSYIKIHIKPTIGGIQLSKLTSHDIQKLVATLRSKKNENDNPLLSDSTIQRIFNIIITALNYAKKHQMVKDNVAKLVDKPRIKKKKLDVWDVDEVRKFLKNMYDHRHYICFHLALASGMRQGEILGLPWSNIDFDKKLIHVTQTLSHDRKEITAGAKSQSGIRSISISDKDVEELKRRKAIYDQEKKDAEDDWHENDLVVCTFVGRPVFADTIGKIFRRENERLGLKPIRYHDCRHTHASLLLKQGVHPKIVQERLGHSSITMTLDTYSHLLPNMQEEAAKGLGNLLFDN